MLTDEEIHDIYAVFKLKGYTWTVDDARVAPNFEQVKDMVTRLFTEVDKEPDGTSISSGRITVHKDKGHYDVLVHMGEVKRESD